MRSCIDPSITKETPKRVLLKFEAVLAGVSSFQRRRHDIIRSGRLDVVIVLLIDAGEFRPDLLCVVTVVVRFQLSIAGYVADVPFAVAEAYQHLIAGGLVEFDFDRSGTNNRVVADAARELYAVGINLASQRALRLQV